MGRAHEGARPFATGAQNRRDRARGRAVPRPRNLHRGASDIAPRADRPGRHQHPSPGERRQNSLQSLSPEARSRPTACWRARRSAETVRRSRASGGEGLVDLAVQIRAGDRRSGDRETADPCGAGVAAEIQLFRFARERARAREAETGRAECADEIRGFQYSTERRRSDDRRSSVRQAAQDREDSDQRAVYREPAVQAGRVRPAADRDGDRRQPAANRRRGQAVHGDARLGA